MTGREDESKGQWKVEAKRDRASEGGGLGTEGERTSKPVTDSPGQEGLSSRVRGSDGEKDKDRVRGRGDGEASVTQTEREGDRQ